MLEKFVLPAVSSEWVSECDKTVCILEQKALPKRVRAFSSSRNFSKRDELHCASVVLAVFIDDGCCFAANRVLASILTNLYTSINFCSSLECGNTMDNYISQPWICNADCITVVMLITLKAPKPLIVYPSFRREYRISRTDVGKM